MKKHFHQWLLSLAAIAWCLVANTHAQQTPQPKAAVNPSYAESIRYENHQNFEKGPAKNKDNNIWVYTAAFAETFGMPKLGIDDLVGAEAVAFRMEDAGYKTCGMGGKSENCMKNTRYMMDVYIDERKYPLPWADPSQMADWLGVYNSSQWLRVGTSHINLRSGTVSASPPGAENSTVLWGLRTLRPFANTETKREVFWMDNAGTDRDLLSDYGWNSVKIYGYKRNAIEGLSLISFDTYPTVSGGSRELRIRLLERAALQSQTLRLFHEIIIPARFIEARAQAVKQQLELEEKFYRSLFPPPLGTKTDANPLPSSSK